MPTYEYECQKCGQQLEVFQKMSEEPLKCCPQCHQESLVQGIGGGSALFRFEGSGFYITDYKKSCSSGCGCHPKKTSSES